MMRFKQSPAQLSAHRGRLAVISALAASAFAAEAILATGRHHNRDPFYFTLWCVWMLISLIWVFGMPGYFRWSAAERTTINDELVKAHQMAAARGALGVALLGLAMLSAATFMRTAIPAWTLPALTSTTVVSAAFIFGWLERRDA